MTVIDPIQQLAEHIDAAKTILVLQPEKPDTDSLASSLSLEQILGDRGKDVVMYCQDEVPTYIRHLDGWDRVRNDFPKQFDMTILVDAGGQQMLTRTLEKHVSALARKPFFILDHHTIRSEMPFPTIDIIDPQKASTGELIAWLATKLNWDINLATANLIIPSILADTLNLTVAAVTADTVQTVADMVRKGASLYELHLKYRESSRLEPEILALKGRLIDRIKYYDEQRIATVEVTPEELKMYAEMHDPSDLVVYEMQNTRGVVIGAVLRNYGTKIKVSMRANWPIAALAAQHFGGGGHPMAAAFRVEGDNVAATKKELVEVLTQLIAEHSTKDMTNAPV